MISGILKKLSGRERALVFITLLLLLFFLIYQLGFVPFLNAREDYEVENAVLEGSFQELLTLAEKYTQEREYYLELKQTLGRKSSIPVLTYLENAAGEIGIRDSIEYIRPKESEVTEVLREDSVEIKIDAIEVSKLLDFLYRIEENRNGLIVTYLRLKPYFRDRSKTDAVVVITDISAL